MLAPQHGRVPHGRRQRRWLWCAAVSAGAVALHAASAFVPPPGARAPAPQAVQAPATAAAAAAAVLGFGTLAATAANAAEDLTAGLTPETFRPVCPASDGFYGVGRGLADALLGVDGQEYRPLAIEALLRVRLEICVLESFVYEALVPFVQKKGLGWVLPLHESIDTVIAGTVFAIALNFILFGTTKILAVLAIYHDFLVGAPLRLISGLLVPQPERPPLIQVNWPGSEVKERPAEPSEPREPPPLPVAVVAGVLGTYGGFAGALREILEGLDTFVGRYLVLVSITYVAFKWAHFRLFNDVLPF